MDARFFSPFETGVRFIGGWRWYWRFLAEHRERIVLRVEADCWACLIARGVVTA